MEITRGIFFLLLTASTTQTSSTLPTPTPTPSTTTRKPDVPEDCLDLHPLCSFWMLGGQCDQNPSWMIYNCPVACSTCDLRKEVLTTPMPSVTGPPASEPPEEVTSSTERSTSTEKPEPVEITTAEPEGSGDVPGVPTGPEITTTPKQEVTSPREEVTSPRQEVTSPREEVTSPSQEVTSQEVECIEETPSCVLWAESGECEANPSYMLSFCQISCGVCGTAPNKTSTVSTTVATTTMTTNATTILTTVTTQAASTTTAQVGPHYHILQKILKS